jgi:hypothetical protein
MAKKKTENTFVIDFFELAFLAEACIPPRPIARAMFWQNLSKIYWKQMTENERAKLFSWMNRNVYYEESLEKEEDTKIFHARFNPDNQYLITYVYDGEEKTIQAFKLNDRYYIEPNKSIIEEYIKKIEKYEYNEQ